MRVKNQGQANVNLITMGCAKNLVDSEAIFTQLKANKFNVEMESEDDQHDIVIINTCGFIEKAKDESIQSILSWAKAKQNGLIDKLIVTGCLSERYKTELPTEIPEVDAWFGTKELPALLKTLKADYKKELLGERLISTPSHYAYLKISEGCDRPCSFCSIPLMRGKHTSVPKELLIEQVKNLVARGTKEIILIAQDLTFYGLDLYRKRTLADLLNKLADVPGVEWLRLQYAYPAGFPTEVLDVIANRPNICKYLDMPLQHASPDMLVKMRRGITPDKTVKLIDEIRNKVPNIALRSTFIVGHPGETKKDFEQLLNFIEQTRFDRVGVFTYSHEEGTHSHSMADDVAPRTKQKRADELMAVQQGISYELNQAKIGSMQKVLLDRFDGKFWIGRTEADSPDVDNEVLIDPKGLNLSAGQFVQAKVYDAAEFDLFAEIV